MKTNNLTTKRFVIRKSLIGENAIITFTNNKDITLLMTMMRFTQHIKKSLKVMKCFQEYKSLY